MPRETMAAKRERALEVARRMNEHYPAAECALVYGGDPFRLTIAVLLSAQTTDKGVNKVTPKLWERYPAPGRSRLRRRARRGGHHPHHRVLPYEGGERHQGRPHGGGRLRRRDPA